MKKYIYPEMNVKKFELESIVTSSGTEIKGALDTWAEDNDGQVVNLDFNNDLVNLVF